MFFFFEVILKRRHDLKINDKRLIAASTDPTRYANFKLSRGCVQNFMKRYMLCVRASTHQAQENSKSKDDKVEDVHSYLIPLNNLLHE